MRQGGSLGKARGNNQNKEINTIRVEDKKNVYRIRRHGDVAKLSMSRKRSKIEADTRIELCAQG
jgi:hypothetical protein